MTVSMAPARSLLRRPASIADFATTTQSIRSPSSARSATSRASVGSATATMTAPSLLTCIGSASSLVASSRDILLSAFSSNEIAERST